MPSSLDTHSKRVHRLWSSPPDFPKKFDMLALLIPPTSWAFHASPVRLWLRLPLHTVCRRLWSPSLEGKICKHSIPHPAVALYRASMFIFCVLHLGMSNRMNAGFKLGQWFCIELDDIGGKMWLNSFLKFLDFFFLLLKICNFSHWYSNIKKIMLNLQ